MAKPSRLPKRTLWIILAVIVLAGAGGFTYYRMFYNTPVEQTDGGELQTATVRRGDLVIYASGSGTLTAASEASFGFGTSGQVEESYVSVGNVVEAGQLLAELDNSSQELDYNQAKRDLAEMTSPYAIASAEQAVAEAQIEVDSAYGSLAYLISPSVLQWEEEIKKLETELTTARQEAETSSSTEVDQKVKELEADLEFAQGKLEGSWDYYEESYLPANFTRQDRETRKKYVARPSDVSIAKARAEYDLAKATLAEAQDYLAVLKGEEIPEDATGESLVAFDNARSAIQSAEEDLNGTRLFAPISGTVISLDFVVGDTVSENSEIITIADLSQKNIEIYLDETDWDKVAVDFDAEVTFDALPDQVFTGKVIQVDPGLYTSNNSSVVHGFVALDTTQTEINLPVGSSAAVDVIAGRAENALLVPIDALRKAGEQYAVFVVENGTPRLRVVEVGIQDILYAEIKSGLNAGDVVTTGIVETQ